jgi:hypothetical protein
MEAFSRFLATGRMSISIILGKCISEFILFYIIYSACTIALSRARTASDTLSIPSCCPLLTFETLHGLQDVRVLRGLPVRFFHGSVLFQLDYSHHFSYHVSSAADGLVQFLLALSGLPRVVVSIFVTITRRTIVVI